MVKQREENRVVVVRLKKKKKEAMERKILYVSGTILGYGIAYLID